MCLAAKCIRNHIGFARMVVYLKVVVFDQFLPTSLPHIQVSLSKDIFEALMVSVDVTPSTHKMMSPDLESMNNCCQFKIMSWIILLMILECSGCKGNDPIVLHKNTTKARSRSIAIDIKRLSIIWLS
jgi:hypothetical protein